MNEYPLLCKPEVVRAILDGRQTQDRRPMKPQPIGVLHEDEGGHYEWKGLQVDLANDLAPYSPFGKPGDVLWVREPFAIKSKSKPLALQRRPIECYMEYVHGADQLKEGYKLVYRADSNYLIKWRPSIHMLREFCRLRLRVKRVWVERVQDISEEDAIAEGIEVSTAHGEPAYYLYNDKLRYTPDPIESFQTLWESLYPGSWDTNVWVWACEFDTISADS